MTQVHGAQRTQKVLSNPFSPLMGSGVSPMAEAESYADWVSAAVRKDRETGHDRWRQQEESRLYDHGLIRRRLNEIDRLRSTGDDIGLYFALQEGIHGNLGGMGRAVLYEKAAYGTKQLIVDYIDAVTDALDHLASDAVSSMSFETKLDFFRRASLCFGHTALMLSGSGSYFFFHVGVLRALSQEGLLPRIMSGSSGGALIAGVVGSRPASELSDALTLDHFRHFVREGADRTPSGRLRKQALDRQDEILEQLLPDLTFAEAYQASGIWINISVAPVDLYQSSRLLNAITSPHVYVREALMASAAVPGAFPPVVLAAKNENGERQAYLPDRRWVDGSISDDLPAKRISRLYGVNHYIVSQTNPHVLPFVTDVKLDTDALSVMKRTAQRTVRELLNGGAALFQRPLSNSPMLTRGVNSVLSVVNQDYLGDINILPPPRFVNPFKTLAFRTFEDAEAMIRAGERATWPKMEMIRLQTKISRTLDRILSDYEDRWAQGRSTAAFPPVQTKKPRWFFF